MATILVVDDNPTNRALLVTLLGYGDNNLLEAADGAEALAVAQARHPDLVIADVLMPVMDGYEFARRLRADPDIAQTRLIFYTATYLEAEARQLAKACGVQYIITKPAEPPEILRTIEAALAEPPPLPAPPVPETFRREHLDLLTNKLSEKVNELEAEIAERKQAEERLRQQARQMRQIMDTVSEGLLLLDRKQQILLANPAASAYLELLAGAGVGERLSHLAGVPLAALLEPPPEGSVAHELVVAGPERRVFELFARPIAAGPVIDGWVLVVGDVTRERQIRERIQQQERLAAVGQLAAGIAHDFNNIMAIIVLYAELLQRNTTLTSKEYQRLDMIHKQATRAADLIHQILDFSRRSVMEQIALNLKPFLKELVRLWQRILPENIICHLVIAEAEYVVRADPTRLQQVLLNLALNARDAMPEGGHLDLALSQLLLEPGQPSPQPKMPPGPWVCLTMTDTGAGIPADVVPHIFEPFFTTKSPGHGTGLGLAQVYGIVRQHEGHITVQSRPEEGTTFAIYLPLAATAEVSHVPESLVSLHSGTETVLLVEDDPGVRAAIQEILEIAGYRVLAAGNGRDALAIMAETTQKPDLVLSDLVMPDMGGPQLYRELQRQWPDLRMIIMTGYPRDDEGKELLQKESISWLHKPFSAQEVIRKVRSVLDTPSPSPCAEG